MFHFHSSLTIVNLFLSPKYPFLFKYYNLAAWTCEADFWSSTTITLFLYLTSITGIWIKTITNKEGRPGGIVNNGESAYILSKSFGTIIMKNTVCCHVNIPLKFPKYFFLKERHSGSWLVTYMPHTSVYRRKLVNIHVML